MQENCCQDRRHAHDAVGRLRFANVAWNVDDAQIGTWLYRERTTLYPASLYAETRLAPMPCDAPVITTTLPLATSTRT